MVTDLEEEGLVGDPYEFCLDVMLVQGYSVAFDGISYLSGVVASALRGALPPWRATAGAGC